MIKLEEPKTLPKMEVIVVGKHKDIDLVIVGGGPAGLSAGIYAVRMGLNTVLVEKAIPGGMISSTEKIENYPGFPKGIKGMDLAKALEDQAKELGLEMIWGDVEGIDLDGKVKKVVLEEETLEAKAVVIATGTEPKKLGIPGESELLGRGVSYCAICDAAFYKEKKVIVIGGGNSAVEEALFLANFASIVTIVHRRDKLRADKIYELRAKNNPKIFFMWDSNLEKIEGSDKVKSVDIKNLKTGQVTKHNVDGVFIYAGYVPNTDFLKGRVKLDENGFIITDEAMNASVKGVFAAGDVRVKQLRQVVTSASDGAVAAFSAHKFLESLK
jgi:thioredoxin reductase (NADPH)